MEEVIPGFEDYTIDTEGNVRSYKRKDTKVLVTSKDNLGYEGVLLRNKETTRRFRIHRLLAVVFIENVNSYPCVNHKDGDKANNELSNLEWCTYSYNSKHAHENGLVIPNPIRGEDHRDAKLTWDIVKTIRNVEFNVSNRKLAKKYNVSHKAIWKVKNNISWNEDCR